MIRVCIAGATGWAGSELARSFVGLTDLDLVAGVSRKHAGRGARCLTGLGVVAPSVDGFPAAASFIAGHRLVKFDVGSQWLLEVTLDNGRQGVTKDLEPFRLQQQLRETAEPSDPDWREAGL